MTELTKEQHQAALKRSDQVRRMIGVVSKGLLPPTPAEWTKQLAKQADEQPNL